MYALIITILLVIGVVLYLFIPTEDVRTRARNTIEEYQERQNISGESLKDILPIIEEVRDNIAEFDKSEKMFTGDSKDIQDMKAGDGMDELSEEESLEIDDELQEKQKTISEPGEMTE